MSWKVHFGSDLIDIEELDPCAVPDLVKERNPARLNPEYKLLYVISFAILPGAASIETLRGLASDAVALTGSTSAALDAIAQGGIVHDVDSCGWVRLTATAVAAHRRLLRGGIGEQLKECLDHLPTLDRDRVAAEIWARVRRLQSSVTDGVRIKRI